MTVLYLLPLALFIGFWHLMTASDAKRQFIFSTPLAVIKTASELIVSGELARQTGVTLFEALAGFALGSLFGTVVGLSLWHSKILARIAKPYITALGSIPIVALAPIIIVWFGIGLLSKIALAFISCAIVALVQSYQGAMSVETRFLRSFQVFGATRMQIFRMLVVPSSVIWVVNAMKLNIGLALLGAFIGEFISSEQGLGYMIVKASGLYDMSRVLVGVATLVVIALLLTYLVERAERHLLSWQSSQLPND